MAKTLQYIVMARRGEEVRMYGPYASFKRAEGDSNAWHGVNQWECSVEPIIEPLKHMIELRAKAPI